MWKAKAGKGPFKPGPSPQLLGHFSAELVGSPRTSGPPLSFVPTLSWTDSGQGKPGNCRGEGGGQEGGEGTAASEFLLVSRPHPELRLSWGLGRAPSPLLPSHT